MFAIEQSEAKQRSDRESALPGMGWVQRREIDVCLIQTLKSRRQMLRETTVPKTVPEVFSNKVNIVYLYTYS